MAWCAVKSQAITWDIIAHHLKSLIVDLEEDSVNIPIPQRVFYDAVLILLKECNLAFDSYYVDRLSDKLHQDLIIAGMNFTTRWERYTVALKAGDFQNSASKTFHEYLLRFSKGALKYYRIWRIDLK